MDMRVCKVNKISAIVRHNDSLELSEAEWRREGATLSGKTACSEFGLTQDEIVAAIRAGNLQYRTASTHGNPWFRLLRREVEELAKAQRGEGCLRERQARNELARVNREIKRLKTQLASLERDRTALRAALGDQ